MKIWVYHKCSTCKDALRFLERHKKIVEVKEITTEPPTLEELKQMLEFQEGNLKKLFNTSGQLYRELQLSQKLDQMPQEKALKLLTQNGMLIKRPFLLSSSIGIVGFHENEWFHQLV